MTEERPGDRELYKQPMGAEKLALASVPENDRVRELLIEDLGRRADAEHSHTARPWSSARGDFVREWVALCEKLGIKGPGDDPRAPLGQHTREGRRIRAGHTRLEQFIEGHLEYAWILCGIEATICDRRGLALPACAYQVQEKLDV